MMKKILLLFIALLISICMSGQQKNNAISGDLIIFHAGSLSVPFKEIAAEFNKLYPKEDPDGIGRQCCFGT
jgi:molybdate/tungstate transport system substrate-binding protein